MQDQEGADNKRNYGYDGGMRHLSVHVRMRIPVFHDDEERRASAEPASVIWYVQVEEVLASRNSERAQFAIDSVDVPVESTSGVAAVTRHNSFTIG